MLQQQADGIFDILCKIKFDSWYLNWKSPGEIYDLWICHIIIIVITGWTIQKWKSKSVRIWLLFWLSLFYRYFLIRRRRFYERIKLNIDVEDDKTLQQLCKQMKTGDLCLFRSDVLDDPGDLFVRIILLGNMTNSDWSHCALVYKDKNDGKIYLIEALGDSEAKNFNYLTGKKEVSGVMKTLLTDRIKNYSGSIAWRQIDHEIDNKLINESLSNMPNKFRNSLLQKNAIGCTECIYKLLSDTGKTSQAKVIYPDASIFGQNKSDKYFNCQWSPEYLLKNH